MRFNDFTKKLALGQLKNTAAVDDQDSGEINPGHEVQLLDLTNQGLVDITTRMKIMEGIYVLTFVPDQNIYTLNGNTDSVLSDYVRLLSVHAVHTSQAILPENERIFIPNTSAQISTPSFDTVRFTDAFMKDYGPAVDIKFQMKHPPIVNATEYMKLPHHLYEALALYVSGLYLSHMGNPEQTSKGDSYYGLYLKMMGEDVMENKSQSSEVIIEDTRLLDRGFA